MISGKSGTERYDEGVEGKAREYDELSTTYA